MSDVPADLHEWRKRKFDDNEICLDKAAQSIKDGKAIVEIRPTYSRSRYTVHPVGKDDIAVFTHAATWLDSTPAQTGNYVKPGSTASTSIPLDKVETRAGFKCEVTYTFDTSKDSSLRVNLLMIEKLADGQEGITKRGRFRRDTQYGRVETYQMSCPLFTRKSPWNERAVETNKVPYTVHPDILEAIQSEPLYVPAMTPPARFLSWENNSEIVALEDSPQPTLERGDIVWFNFTVAFIVGKTNWWAEAMPMEIMRVGRRAAMRGGSINYIPHAVPRKPMKTGKVSFISSGNEGSTPGDQSVPTSAGGAAAAEATSGGKVSDVPAQQSVPASAGGAAAAEATSSGKGSDGPAQPEGEGTSSASTEHAMVVDDGVVGQEDSADLPDNSTPSTAVSTDVSGDEGDNVSAVTGAVSRPVTVEGAVSKDGDAEADAGSRMIVDDGPSSPTGKARGPPLRLVKSTAYHDVTNIPAASVETPRTGLLKRSAENVDDGDAAGPSSKRRVGRSRKRA